MPAARLFWIDLAWTSSGTALAISTALPMDLPVGPDYVLGPGDGLNIDFLAASRSGFGEWSTARAW